MFFSGGFMLKERLIKAKYDYCFSEDKLSEGLRLGGRLPMLKNKRTLPYVYCIGMVNL